MQNHPTRSSIVAYMLMDDETKIGVAAERVSDVRELCLLGISIVETYTGLTPDEIRGRTKGPKFFFDDDAQTVIAGMSIDAGVDGEWGFVLLDSETMRAVPELFANLPKLN